MVLVFLKNTDSTSAGGGVDALERAGLHLLEDVGVVAGHAGGEVVGVAPPIDSVATNRLLLLLCGRAPVAEQLERLRRPRLDALAVGDDTVDVLAAVAEAALSSAAARRMATNIALSDSLRSVARLARRSCKAGGMRITTWTTVSGMAGSSAEDGSRRPFNYQQCRGIATVTALPAAVLASAASRRPASRSTCATATTRSRGG
jgi:hypothetical protein